MSLRYFLHILFKRKWLILIALFMAPLIAAGVLVFAEPVFVSHCKLEVHDRSNPNDPMSTVKSTIKDDVFIQTQIDLIFTDRVMSRVVDEAGLIPTPPSQSIFARYAGAKYELSKYPPDRERIELIRALKSPAHIKADAMSSVVLNITAQMNTPELAQKLSAAVLHAYKDEFARLQGEDTQFEKFYTARLIAIDAEIAKCQREMEEFNRLHPRSTVPGTDPLQLPVPDQNKGNLVRPAQPNAEAIPPAGGNLFNATPAEIGPVQLLMNEIAAREIELIDIESKNSMESYRYKSVAEKIEADRKLLEQYKQKLSDQQVLAVQYSYLIWKMDTLRQQRQKNSEDLLRVKNAEMAGSTMATIKVQDDPTFDPQPIYPKKSLILIASVFIGLMLGLALAYIAHVLDSTYHLPEDFAADTGIPVLAAIPFEKTAAVYYGSS